MIRLNQLLQSKLSDVLTDEQKIRKISNLLSALKKEGIIELTNGKKWILVKVCKRLHDDVLHISKKPLRGELSGFLSICQAEASCIFPTVCLAARQQPC